MKLCKDCGVNERYSSQKTGKVYSYCKACQAVRVTQHQRTEKGKATLKRSLKRYAKTEKGKAAIRRSNRNQNRKKNGFTQEMFNDMLFNQDFKCALCYAEINISSHADHDHKTGKARAILCHSCNTLLGRIENKGFDWVDKAKLYVDSFR